MKLVLLAAGRGTRFLPVTENLPKALVPFLDATLVDYVLAAYIPSVSSIIAVVNESTGSHLMRHLGERYRDLPVSYAVQTSRQPRGTWSALGTAYAHLADSNELFCVCNCDDIVAPKDVAQALSQNTTGCGVALGSMHSGYVSLEFVPNGNITGQKIHPDSTGLVHDFYPNGMYVLDRHFFSFDPVATRDGEYGLPHTVFAHMQDYPLRAFEFTSWQSVNSPNDIPVAMQLAQSLGLHI